jgi:hypothetical protein
MRRAWIMRQTQNLVGLAREGASTSNINIACQPARD